MDLLVGLKMPLKKRSHAGQAALVHEYDIIKSCGDGARVVRVFGWCLADEESQGMVKSLMMEFLPLGE